MNRKKFICFVLVFLLIVHGTVITLGADNEMFEYAIAYSDASKIGIEKTTTNLGAVELETEKVVLDSKMRESFAMTGMPVTAMAVLTASQNISVTALTVGADCVSDPKNNVLGLYAGMSVNINDLIAAAVLYNDINAVRTLALGTSGSYSEFIDLMNRTARRYSMKNTVFKNINGAKNAEQTTTIEDMLILIMAIYNSTSIFEITSSDTYYIRTTEIYNRQKTLSNKFELVDPNSSNYKSTVLGLGSFTDSDGVSITLMLTQSENERYAVALRTEKKENRISDAASAVDYIYKNFALVDITKVLYNIGDKVDLKVGGEPVSVAVSKGKYKNIYLVVNAFYSKSAFYADEYTVLNPQSLPTHVNVGDEIKGFTVMYKNTKVATIDMTVKSVGEQQTTKKQNSFTIYQSENGGRPKRTLKDHIWVLWAVAAIAVAAAILLIFGRKK